MLIIGAKGFAVQLIDVLVHLGIDTNCVYFDDTSNDPISFLSRFRVIRNVEEASNYLLNEDKRFALGIGKPSIRSYFFYLFERKGGEPTSIISPHSNVGKYDVKIGAGSCVLTNVIIESTVEIGRGALINLNTTITHGCKIGDFCEISPGVNILGDCNIGSFCSIGSNAVILPKVSLGKNVVVGAGAVVTKDVPDNMLVVGVPAKPIKSLDPLTINLSK